MMILQTLGNQARHGYSITRKILSESEGILNVEEGSLYPALHRMEKKNLVSSHWERSENNRKAKFYSITDEGRVHLSKRKTSWQRASAAVNLVMSGKTENKAS